MSLGNIQTFDYSINVQEALLWQYQPATHLQSLLASKQAWYAQANKQFWDDWYTNVFDLRTANEFGLSVWAIILRLPIAVTPPSDREVFGFDPFYLNFLNSNFADDPAGISLSLEETRLLLRLRYFQLVSDGCAFNINAFLAYLFEPLGQVYVLDGLDMTCEYVFRFIPSTKLQFVFSNFDILPRPAGVQLRILINPGDSFGFDPYYLNFHSANFAGG